jgi:2-oxoisovalerate dehydrogenase E1 component alpha subunit
MQRKPTVALATLEALEIDAEDFHTGLNFAGVFRLPVIFLCINDGKSASLMTSETIAVRALAYGIAGVRIDGSDFLAVAATVRDAAARGRCGEGATLIEAVVGQGDDGTARLAAWLAATKVLDAAAEATMRREVDGELREALAAEESAGLPPRRALIENVLAAVSGALEEQLDDLERIRDKTARP